MTAPSEAALQLAVTRLIQNALPHSLEGGYAPLYPTWEAATRIFDAIKPYLRALPPAAPSAAIIEQLTRALFEEDREHAITDCADWDELVAKGWDVGYQESAVRIYEAIKPVLPPGSEDALDR